MPALTDTANDLGVEVGVVDADEWAHGETMGVCEYPNLDDSQPRVKPKARSNQADLAEKFGHEYAYVLLHVDDDTKRLKREVEAEAVAYIVGLHFDLDTNCSANPRDARELSCLPGLTNERCTLLVNVRSEIDCIQNYWHFSVYQQPHHNVRCSSMSTGKNSGQDGVTNSSGHLLFAWDQFCCYAFSSLDPVRQTPLCPQYPAASERHYPIRRCFDSR